MSPSYDIFLSHATADKPAVEYLARKLQEAGIAPFLDKWHLIPGRVWQTELANGLRNSDACAIFVGSEKFGPWHTQEMLVALDRAARNPEFPVIPVLLPGFKKPSEIPEFLAQRTWVEFSKLEDEDAFHRLICGIRGEIPEPGGGPVKPPRPSSYRSMAQAPEEFIHRGEYDRVLEALCLKEGAVLSGTSIGITTALRGAGGFGKTALAQKLCQDQRVRAAYPDGILWTTMGEDIDANGRLSQVRDLIRWWTQEKEAPNFETVSVAGARLRELLATSRVLIVIDDVWSSADVTPFQGIGNGSALLITTRDSQTLPSGSQKIEVGAMASAEAVKLLRFGLPDEQEREFISLAAQLGEWPLLLKMVNRQLRELVNDERRPVQVALKEINEALDSEGFAAFDREDQESRHAAASKTILVSIQRLAEKDRERYFNLAVFPEDVQIPVSVLDKLWNLGNFRARKFCRRLHDLSLLLEFNSELETVRLHDVVRRVLIEQVGEELPNLHRRLLEAFRPLSGIWPDLQVGERYLWRNLASHLLGAKREDELNQLLTDLSFLQAKLNATDVNALIADYKVLAQEERELKLIRDALRLSAHVLVRDRGQLASQIWGRLIGIDGKSIRKLLDHSRPNLFLLPKQGDLFQAGGSLLRTLEGDPGRLTTVTALSSRQVISGSQDEALRIWDLETGEIIYTLKGHSGVISSVAVLGGDRVVSSSHDMTLKVWDLKTGKTIHDLKEHTGGINAVVALGDGGAISASNDETLLVWDLENGKALHTFRGHSHGVTAVAVLDGERIISGSYDQTLRVWSLKNGETLRILPGHSGAVSSVAVLEGERVISGSHDKTLRMWDLKTGETLCILQGHTEGITSVAVLDGGRIISGSYDGTLRVWDLKDCETLQILEGHLHWVQAVVAMEGNRVVSCSHDKTLREWDLGVRESPRNLQKNSGAVTAVGMLSGRYAVSGSHDNTVLVWDLETGETLHILEGHSQWITAVALLGDQRAVSGSWDGTLRVWDLKTGKTLHVLEGHSSEVTAVAALDSRYVISGSGDWTMRVWDSVTGMQMQSLEGHSAGVSALAILGNHYVVSAGSYEDETLRVWDLETGKCLRTFNSRSGVVNTLAVLDGRRAISSSADQTLRVWDLETGETSKPLKGHSEKVTGVALWDSNRVVSSSDDGTLRVWNLETGETLAVVTLDASIAAVAVSPDRRIVMAGDKAGRVHYLDWVEPEGIR